MNNKRLLLLGLVLVLLVAVALLLMEMPGERSATPDGGDLLLDLDSATVTKVEIVSPSYSVTLAKRGAQWELVSPVADRADQSAAASLIGEMSSLRSRSVVSTNPEKRNLFNVDSTGTVVTLAGESGQPMALVIGKVGGTYRETYVRRRESNDVHLVQASLTFLANRGVNGWRDKAIVKVPREEIRSVTYQYGDTVFTLEFRDSLWAIGGVPADDPSINILLASLADLQADDFVEPPPSPAPALKAVVSYAGKEIRFFPGRTADVYSVQRSGDLRWFEMRSWRAQQILKRESDLRARQTQ